jgi:hypothetical protein
MTTGRLEDTRVGVLGSGEVGRRLAAGFSGIHLVGPTKDSVGRRGVAVAFTRDGLEDELIVDPDEALIRWLEGSCGTSSISAAWR